MLSFKKTKNFFLISYAITKQKLNLPSRSEDKSTCQEKRRATHRGRICEETQRIVVEFVGMAQSIVVGLFEARSRLADYNC